MQQLNNAMADMSSASHERGSRFQTRTKEKAVDHPIQTQARIPSESTEVADNGPCPSDLPTQSFQRSKAKKHSHIRAHTTGIAARGVTGSVPAIHSNEVKETKSDEGGRVSAEECV